MLIGDYTKGAETVRGQEWTCTGKSVSEVSAHGDHMILFCIFLYTLLFADDQVVIAMDEQDSSYMISKLHEQYKNWGLDINYEKTEQLVIGREGKDMVLGPNTIRDCVRFKYLGVMLTKEGTSNEEIDNKIIQGRKAIGKLSSVLWNDEITMKTKQMIFSTIVESIITYGSETWK